MIPNNITFLISYASQEKFAYAPYNKKQVPINSISTQSTTTPKKGGLKVTLKGSFSEYFSPLRRKER